ncbi:MAG: ketoacyl-ACP synthase III [Clostridia bacterium]|nr:ketoacyl-ACP synthase III [Clostridia bacterium]
MKHSVIAGIGHAVGEKVMTNFDMMEFLDTSDEWISERTGIKERRVAAEDVYTSDLAAQAGKEAVESAGISVEDVDMIIVASVTPETLTPHMSCLVQKKIGAKNANCLDINTACTGFLAGLNIADCFVKCGEYQNVLVIGSETLTKTADWKDRKTCILFGDGAGAAVVQPTEEDYGLMGHHFGADGELGHTITLLNLLKDQEEMDKRISGIPQTLWMNGGEVFKFAVRAMINATKEAVKKSGIQMEDLNWLIPHQANSRIIEGAAKRLRLAEGVVYDCVRLYGNMGAASIPVALYDANAEGKLKDGDIIAMTGFGGGLCYGSIVMKWKAIR